MKTQKRWFVGIDWATQVHAVCLLDSNGKILGEQVFAHSGEGIAKMCAWLLETSGAKPSELFVAIEVPRGAVVESLLERGMIVHSINPKQVDRFRDRFTVAGAKDDRRDAYVLADSLRTDTHCFRILRVDEPTVVELREWSRIAKDLSDERIRLSNRIYQQLLRYYPQMLDLTDDLGSEFSIQLWELIPTPARAQKVREISVEKLLIERRIRRFTAKHVLSTLRQPPLVVTDGTIQAACVHITALVERIRLVNKQIAEANRQLDRLTNELEAREAASEQKGEQRRVEILRSFPGIGRIVLATLLAEASQPLADRDYHALRALSGVAPVTRSSGKRTNVGMRRACNVRLREAVYHWARVAMQHDPKSRRSYAELRARGHTHGRAIRGIADRLLQVLCAMLRNGKTFDMKLRYLTVAANHNGQIYC